MKRAAIVLGSESSGCRWMTRLLVQCGFVEDKPTKDTELLVIRRSYPWNKVWPELLFVHDLIDKGWQPHMVVTIREAEAMAKSKLAAGHCDTIGTARWEIRQAYKLIFGERCKPLWRSWIIVPYESLILHLKHTVAGILRQVGGKMPAELEPAVDGNAKHYERKQQ